MSELKPCEAIEILEDIYPSKKQIVTGEYPEVAEALDMAIAALRRAQPTNEPMTLEQLREMYGEPVWIVDGNVHCWMIVERADSWLMHFAEKENCGVGLPFAGYGKTWIAYRRKPEGSES